MEKLCHFFNRLALIWGIARTFLKIAVDTEGGFLFIRSLSGACTASAPRWAMPSNQTRGSHREVPVERRCFGLSPAGGLRMPRRPLFDNRIWKKRKRRRRGPCGWSILATRGDRRQDSGRSAFQHAITRRASGRGDPVGRAPNVKVPVTQ